MPRVPGYDNLQARLDPLPGVRQTSNVTPGLMGGVAAEQMQQAGRGLMNLGSQFAKQVVEAQNEANQLRVDDAVNKAKEAVINLTFDRDNGYINQRGINALERQSGKPLSDEYSDKLQESISKISEGLGNDEQRRLFAMKANDIGTQFRGQLSKFEGEQFVNYQLSVREGTIANRTNEIALFYNDPARIDEAVTSIKASVADMARLQGKSAEWADAQSKKLTSNAHKTALEAALQKNDLTYADQYIKKYASQMDADDILRVNGLITKELDAKLANVAVQNTMAIVQPKMQTSDMDRLTNLVMATESGGKDFGADGKMLTSPAGAKGRMQVLDSTNKDPGFGVKPAQDDSPDERARVGRDYLQAMLREYKGNVPQALAAYNAGPGNVNDALAKAKAANDDANWMNYLPKPSETIPYVTGIMKAYGTGDGAYQKPTLQDVHAEIRKQIGDSNPNRLKLALESATQQYNETEKAIKQREDEAVATSLRGLYENGGRFSELPVSVRANIPPEKLTSVMDAAARIAKGDDTTSLWLYNKLTNNPDELARMSENEFYALRTSLSEADFKHFSQERAKRRGAVPNTNGPGDLNSQAIKGGLDTRLRMMGADPTPKDGSSDAERVGAMRKFVDGYFIAAQREAGKKFTDAEVEQHLDALFMKNATVRGWFSSSSVPILSMKAGDIDSAEKEAIKAAFKRAGNDRPTDAQILDLYWKGKFKR